MSGFHIGDFIRVNLKPLVQDIRQYKIVVIVKRRRVGAVQ